MGDKSESTSKQKFFHHAELTHASEGPPISAERLAHALRAIILGESYTTFMPRRGFRKPDVGHRDPSNPDN